MAKEQKREPSDSLYGGLMEEMKIRLKTVDGVLLDNDNLPGAIARELCYLQLRMCCEVLALACLVAHGDIVASQPTKLRDQYKADQIIKMLEALHSDFFPVPGRMENRPDRMLFHAYEKPVLTKAELLSFYGRSGDVLHRGHMRTLLSRDEPLREAEPAEIRAWLKKFWGLLVQHRISLISGVQLICALENGPEKKVGILRTAAIPELQRDIPQTPRRGR